MGEIRIAPAAFFDLETSEWDQFVLGGLVLPDGTFEHSGYPWNDSNERDFYARLRQVRGELWGWNSGKFDTLWVLEQARSQGDYGKVSAAGTRVTRAELGKLVCRDAVALIPMSLEKAAGIAELTATKDTGLPCTDECKADRESDESCGGYCSITRELTAPQWRTLCEYLENDCRVGWAVLQRIIEAAEEWDLDLRGTVGASSYATLARRVDLEAAAWEWRHYKLARSAYFGGRCQVLQPAAAAGHRLDIHSAYPAALSETELPCGDCMEVGGAKAQRAYQRCKEGVYTATVDVPRDMFLPPLPWRLGGRRDGRGSRVCYPVGTLRGTWTRIELEYAASLGCRVDVHAGLVWSDADAFLAEPMDELWQHRADVGPSTPLGKWVKWFLNSATGKLAESPHKDAIHVCPDHARIRPCPGASGRGGSDYLGDFGCTDELCRGTCDAWKMIDKKGEVWAQPVFRIPDNGHIQCAAYLTAAARIKWHRQAIDDGVGGLTTVYGDTDSVFATEPRTRWLGDDLGQWGYDGPFFDFRALAPKCYGYRDADGVDHVRAKGLSGISAKELDRFFRGETIVRTRGVKGLRSAARAGGSLFVRKYIARSSNADGIHFGDRTLRRDGRTWPRTTKELERWHKGN